MLVSIEYAACANGAMALLKAAKFVEQHMFSIMSTMVVIVRLSSFGNFCRGLSTREVGNVCHSSRSSPLPCSFSTQSVSLESFRQRIPQQYAAIRNNATHVSQ